MITPVIAINPLGFNQFRTSSAEGNFRYSRCHSYRKGPAVVLNQYDLINRRGENIMGLFDKMFGNGASEAEQQQGAQQRFNELKQKYQSVLNMADQQQIQFQNLHVQDNKLYIRGIAPSEDAKNKFWDQIKLVNPNSDDVTADINVDSSRAMGATAGGSAAQGGETYEIKSGDTLSKISKQFYGNANEYMRIFYANRDKLNDPDKIQAGQKLVIPPDDKA